VQSVDFPGDDIGAFGPNLVRRVQLLHFVRMLRGEIVCLRAIGVGVVEFPRLLVRRDQFPFALTNGAIALMFPEERALREAVWRRS
jgi:hypothetical protein